MEKVKFFTVSGLSVVWLVGSPYTDYATVAHRSSRGPSALAQFHFRAVQCRQNVLRVFKWKCAHYSRVVPVKFIIVSSPLPEQGIVLH
jgi:hypothetical protein